MIISCVREKNATALINVHVCHALKLFHQSYIKVLVHHGIENYLVKEFCRVLVLRAQFSLGHHDEIILRSAL